MLKRKFNRCRTGIFACCVFAFMTSESSTTFGQFGGAGAVQTDNSQVDDGTPSQRIYPNGLPKIETMLSAALEHHPEVVTARSRLRIAEAELKQAQMKSLKELMDVRGRWEEANHVIMASKQTTKPNYDELRKASSSLAAIEWELAFLTGARGEPTTSPKPATVAKGATSEPTVVAPVVGRNFLLRGEKADIMREKLKQKIELNFEDMTLSAVARELTERTGLQFILDKSALEEGGLSVDLPITCSFSDLELVSALQALEDLQKPLYFVVRDYGILMTTLANRSSETISARDFGTLNEVELRDLLERQRKEETNKKADPSSGGGYF